MMKALMIVPAAVCALAGMVSAGQAVTQRSFHVDRVALLNSLHAIHQGVEGGALKGSALERALDDVLGGMAGARFPANPPGGGAGYKDVIRNGPRGEIAQQDVEERGITTNGLRVVSFHAGIRKMFRQTTYEYDFLHALQEAKSGDVIYIPGDAVVDFSDWKLIWHPSDAIVIPEGVTIASDRGAPLEGGGVSRGGVLKFGFLEARLQSMFRMLSGTRLTGLVLEGPSPSEGHLGAYTLTTCAFLDGDDIRIDNCEVSGFSDAGFVSVSGKNHRIHDSYFHHIRDAGGGVAIRADGGEVTAERNLFANVRAATAGNVKGSGNANAPARALAPPAPGARPLAILTQAVYGDIEQAYDALAALRGGLSKVRPPRETVAALWGIISDLAVFDSYFGHEHTVTVDGNRYGAYVEEGGSPIGGGGRLQAHRHERRPHRPHPRRAHQRPREREERRDRLHPRQRED